MRLLLGFVTGIAAVVLLASRYGQDWSESLHSAAASVREFKGGTELAAPAALPEEIALPVEPVVVEAGPISDSGPTPEPERAADRWLAFRDQQADLLPAGDYPWRRCFERAAAAYQLPQALLLAVARGESDFDATARSDANAIGVMQILWPGTAQHLGIRQERRLYDPCTNIDAGARYLRELVDRYEQDYHLAVAAYNYGPARVSVNRVPELARQYSEYILDHLQEVLGQTHPAAARQSAGPAGDEAGRLPLLRFSQAYRAEAFLQYLREAAPGLNLIAEREARGNHTVYLTFGSASERRQALQLIASSGVLLASSDTSATTINQEKSYDF